VEANSAIGMGNILIEPKCRTAVVSRGEWAQVTEVRDRDELTDSEDGEELKADDRFKPEADRRSVQFNW
jgi:hypothetical protein